MALVNFLVYDAWSDFLGWIDSVDWGNVVFYIAFVLLAVTIVSLSIWLVVAHSKDNEFRNEMTYESSTVRVFRVDAAHDVVRYFNLSNIGLVKSQTLNQFYASFPLSEQGKVREWITSILNGEPHSTYLATDVIFHKERHMTTTTASSALATLKSWDSSEPTDVTESYHSTGDGNVTLAISQKATSSTKASNGTTVFNNNLIVSNDATEGSNKTTAKFSWGSAKVAIPSLSGYTKK